MNHSERAHAILSPSFMHIALQCSGAVGLKEKIPQAPAGTAAIKGTLTHEAAEIVLSDWLAHKKDGSDPDIRAHLLNPDKTIIEAAIGWKNAIWEHALEKSITNKAYALEDRLTFSEKYSLWGTADFWMVATDERAKRFGLICDLKSGHVYVEVDKNPQLAAYAVSLRQEMRDGGKDLDYVRVAIYQPYAEGEKYRETAFTAKQLDTWEKKFLKLAEDVFGGTSKFKVGEHCTYCPCQAHCELYGKSLSKETSLALIDTSELVFPDVAKIPDEALVKIALKLKALDAFGKAVKKSVIERLSNGEKLVGIKAVEGGTRRTWDQEKEEDLKLVLSKFGVDAVVEKVKGIGDLEKELANKLGAKEGKKLLNPFTKQTKPSILLVEEADERPAISSMVDLLDETNE